MQNLFLESTGDHLLIQTFLKILIQDKCIVNSDKYMFIIQYKEENRIQFLNRPCFDSPERLLGIFI